jgi:hypothetical protein
MSSTHTIRPFIFSQFRYLERSVLSEIYKKYIPYIYIYIYIYIYMYRNADKSLARPTSRCILFDGEIISFDASLIIYINSTNINYLLLIMIINRISEHQKRLSL